MQDIIANDPSIQGLGDLILRDREGIHPCAGRLDLLLQDPDSLKRYDAEDARQDGGPAALLR